MARQALGPNALRVGQAVRAALTGVDEAVVGCSGGPDSMALALGAQWASRFTGTSVSALIVDHQLQHGSARVAERTREVLEQRGLDATVLTVEVVDEGEGPEAAARQARRQALVEAAGEAVVLLGHTLDDQAETVLLRLTRGSGPASLAAMEPSRGPFRRPLLEVRRATTEEACREWGVDPWHDPHNSDPRFLRSRVRRDVMPVLEDVLGPGVAEALARSAALCRQDDLALAAQARQWWVEGHRRPGQGPLDVAALEGVSRAVASRVVKTWLEAHGGPVGRRHVEDVLGLPTRRGGAGVDVPGGRVEHRAGRLTWRSAAAQERGQG